MRFVTRKVICGRTDVERNAQVEPGSSKSSFKLAGEVLISANAGQSVGVAMKGGVRGYTARSGYFILNLYT